LTVTRRIIFGVISGWGSKAVNILISLVQIPLFYRYLSKEVLGVWFLMIGAQMVLGLFDLGFGQTLQRRIAFAKGACGADLDIVLSDSARQAIVDLLALGGRVYIILSAVAAIGLIIGGGFYFQRLELSPSARESLRLAWIVMAIGYAANMWGWMVEATLNGLGDIGWSSIIATVFRVLELGAIWLVLALGYGLTALALVWTARGVAIRLCGWLVVIRLHPWISRVKGRPELLAFKSMVRPALEWWAAVAGYFFLARVSPFFIGALMGPAYVSDYYATYTALAVVQGTLVSIVSVGTPLFSQMWRAGSLDELQSFAIGLMRLSMGLLTASYVSFVFFSKDIFTLWLGKAHFLGYPVIIILSLMMFIEAHQGTLMTFCVATERLQFYKIIILGGIISLPLSYILIKNYGILGAALSILISGMLTQNWFIPMMSLKLLKLSFLTIIKKVLLPCLYILISLLLFGFLLKALNLTILYFLIIYIILSSLLLYQLLLKKYVKYVILNKYQ
jgi:O-antigen/teichoic acid export membrane protein